MPGVVVVGAGRGFLHRVDVFRRCDRVLVFSRQRLEEHHEVGIRFGCARGRCTAGKKGAGNYDSQ